MVITASDGAGQTNKNFTLTVSDNDNPTFDPLAPQQVEEGRQFSFNIQSHDAQGDGNLSLSAQDFPAFASLQDNGGGAGTITLDTHIGDFGNYNLKVVANDGNGGIQVGTFKVVVQKANISQTINVNFDKKSHNGYGIDNNWNNLFYGTDPSTQAALENVSGDPSGIVLQLTDFSGSGTENDYSGTGVYPFPVEKTYWSVGTIAKSMVFTGLNRSLKYAFSVLGNSGSANQSMRYTIGSQNITIATQNNDSNLAVFDPVSPDNNGQITLTVVKTAGSNPGPINALVIEVSYDNGLPPTAPEITQIQAQPGNQVGLTWNDNSNNESGFKIYRATSASGPFTEVQDLAKNTTSFTDTDGTLTGHFTYFYRVDAYNQYGSSSSLVFAVATLNNPPEIVSNGTLIVPAGQATSINITATDEDNDNIVFSSPNLPSFAVLTDHGDGTATIVFNPQVNDIGNYNGVIVNAQDGFDGNSNKTVFLHVINGQYDNSIYVNFSAAANVASSPWNNVTAYASGSQANNLVDIQGNNTTVGLTTGSGWSQTSDDGVTTGSDIGILEDNVMKSYWLANTTGNMTITNLDPAKRYNIVVFGSVPDLNSSASYTVGSQSGHLGISQNRDSVLTFSGVQPNSSGAISISAIKQNGVGAAINAISIHQLADGFIATPTNLLAIGTSKTTIKLTWFDNAYNETGYQIFRKRLPNGPNELLTTTAANIQSFTDNNGLLANHTYSYRVRAVGPMATATIAMNHWGPHSILKCM